MNPRQNSRMQISALVVGVLTISLASLGLTLIPDARPPMNPVATIDAFHQATQNDDTDGLIALFADDAIVIDQGTVVEGTEQIRGWVESVHMPAALHIEMIDFQLDGEKVIWSDRAYSESGSACRLDTLSWEAVIQKGKIQSLTVRPLPMADGM